MEERIPDAQKLPLGWIIPEDAQIILRRADMLLPPELVLDIRPREMPVYPPKHKYNQATTPYTMVELPGYTRVTEGYSQREIQRLTGVHHNTQRKIIEGKKASVDVAWRLAKGLDVDMDELLRRG